MSEAESRNERKKKMQDDRVAKFIAEGNLEIGDSANSLHSAMKVKQRLAVAKQKKKKVIHTDAERRQRKKSIVGLAKHKESEQEMLAAQHTLEALEANTDRDELIGSLSKFGDGDGSYFDRWLGGNDTDTSSFSAGWITPLSGFKASPLAKKGAMAIMGKGGVCTPVLELRLKLQKKAREEEELDRVARLTSKERKTVEKEKQRKIKAEKKEFLRHMYGDLYVEEDEEDMDDDDDEGDEEQRIMDAKSTKEEKAQYMGGAEMRKQEMLNAEKIISKTYEFNAKQAQSSAADDDPERAYQDTLAAVESSTFVGGRASRHQFFACYKEEEQAYHKLSSSQSEVKLSNEIERGVDAALSKRDRMHLEIDESADDREKASKVAQKGKKGPVVAASVGKEVDLPADGAEEKKEKAPPSSPSNKGTPAKKAGTKGALKKAQKKGAKDKKGGSSGSSGSSGGGGSSSSTPLGGALRRFDDGAKQRTTFGLPAKKSAKRPKMVACRKSSTPSLSSPSLSSPSGYPPIAGAADGHTVWEMKRRREGGSSAEEVRFEAAEVVRQNEAEEKKQTFGFHDATGARTDFLDELRKQQLPPEPLILRQMQIKDEKGNTGTGSSMRLNHLKMGTSYSHCLSTAMPAMLGRIRDLDVTDNRLTPAAMIQLLSQFCPPDEGKGSTPASGNRYSLLNSLSVAENKMSVGAVGVLVRVIHAQKKLKALNVSQCSLGERGGVLLMDAVYESALEKLVLAHNKLGSMTGMRCADVLKDLWSLQELQLQWNNIRGPGAIAISQALAVNDTVTALDLGWNGWGGVGGKSEDAAACVLGTSLRSNKTLRLLHLQYNNIGPKGFVCLSGALHHNHHLQTVVLDGNRPSLEGLSATIHALNTLGGAVSRAICCACSAGSIKEERQMPKPKIKPGEPKKEQEPAAQKPAEPAAKKYGTSGDEIWYRGRAEGTHNFDLADDYGWAAAQELLRLLSTRPIYSLEKNEVQIKPEKGAPAKISLEKSGVFEDPESGEVVPNLSTYSLGELENLGREGTLCCTVTKDKNTHALLYEAPILTPGGETLVKCAIRRWGEGFAFDRECFIKLVCGELYVESVVQQRLWFVVDAEAQKHEELQKNAVALLANMADVHVGAFGDTLHHQGSAAVMAQKRDKKFALQQGIEVCTCTMRALAPPSSSLLC
jgi:hypothetical protein